MYVLVTSFTPCLSRSSRINFYTSLHILRPRKPLLKTSPYILQTENETLLLGYRQKSCITTGVSSETYFFFYF